MSYHPCACQSITAGLLSDTGLFNTGTDSRAPYQSITSRWLSSIHVTLQVEHPVTEWISHVNIPSCQLLIGMGVPLNRIPDIRRVFGKDPMGIGAIDFDNEPQLPPSGPSMCQLHQAYQLGCLDFSSFLYNRCCHQKAVHLPQTPFDCCLGTQTADSGRCNASPDLEGR